MSLPPPDATELLRHVAAFRGRRVVVLGDLVVDEFIHGDIARVSREAPVLILEHRQTRVAPGGGANSATNLRALGAAPLPVGVVGRDDAGRALLSELRKRSVPTSGILVVPGYATPCKSRILAGGVHTRRQQIVRVDRGAPRGRLTAAVRRQLRGRLRKALKGTEGLLVADYDYGAADPEDLNPLIARLTRGGTPVMVDSRSRVARYLGATACTPNQEELEGSGGRALDSEEAFEEAGRALLRRTRNEAVLVTRGARGMCLFRRRRAVQRIPAWGPDEVADVTGAGDTVIAAFSLGRICGAGWLDAARLANYAAGLVVAKSGTATVSANELSRAIRRGDA